MPRTERPTALAVPSSEKRDTEPEIRDQPLMAVVPDEDIWVTANLKETQLTKLVVGNEVEFTVDAYPGQTFRGRVASLSPATGARFVGRF